MDGEDASENDLPLPKLLNDCQTGSEALRISFFEAIDTPRDPGFHQGFAEI